MPEDERDENRLSRWSKRKLAVAKEREQEATSSADAVDVEGDAEIEAQLLANREAAEAVDLETLDKESDFSVFLKEGVPELLKKQAMLALWRSNPIFANVDGLVDYDDDFGSPDLLMKTFKSAYQAGRGYLEHIERLAKVDEAAEDAAAETLVGDDDADAEQVSPEPEAEPGPETEDIADETVELSEDAEPAENEETEHAVDMPLEPLFEEPAPRVSLRRRLELES